jgi:hypothetical protein
MNTRNLLVAAALGGALLAVPASARAGEPDPTPAPTADKQSCKGQAGQADKASCQGKAPQGKDAPAKSAGHDKVACAGKDGCGAKEGKDVKR